METARIRVLCVDDHRLVREGIKLIIDRQPDMEVVACATTGEESIPLFRRFRPDLTLMDLQLASMSGLDAIRAIRGEDAEARIIVLTMYQGDEDIYRALEAGAATYLLKDTLSDDLIRVMREVHAGKHPIVPDVKACLDKRDPTRVLTRREIEVIKLMSEGMRNKEIAAALHISEDTAQVHVKNILAKLKVNDRTAAVNVALRRGMVHIV
jgi:DNA-binding NarL/FixJ family response regulator